jgi:peptidoglycan/LPS O-acetylase OafA/YrhL
VFAAQLPAEPSAEAFFYITLAYVVLYLGSSRWFRYLKLPGDYSYGIYIYGFLVQQVFAQFLPQLSAVMSLVVTIPAVVLVSVLSWHGVEHSAIGFGKKLGKMKNRF